MIKGRINSIQSMGTVDGPGVRFVVFLQGCNLRCAYCHNPETWDSNSGMKISADEVFERAKKYRSYFGEKGGITLTGGEPLLQADFLCELLTLCKNEGIHSVIDTNGSVWTPKAKEAIGLANLLLVDLKMNTDENYESYIGAKLEQVLAFIKETAEMEKDLWIRQVIMPGINDKPEDIKALKKLLEPFSNVKKIELLPFKKLCLEKYQSLKIPFPLAYMPETTNDTIVKLEQILNNAEK